MASPRAQDPKTTVRDILTIYFCIAILPEIEIYGYVYVRVHAGGACGIKDVNLAACGNIPIFKDGKGCGSCYEVPTIHQASRVAVHITKPQII